MNATLIRGYLILISAMWSMSLPAEIHYVDMNSTNSAGPYTNWATAANDTVIARAIPIAIDFLTVPLSKVMIISPKSDSCSSSIVADMGRIANPLEPAIGHASVSFVRLE